jgi:hypothetical protein
MAHLAASRGYGECFSCLLIHGAQLDVYTFDRHESVLNIAKRSGKNSRIEQARKFNFIQKQMKYYFNRFRCYSLSWLCRKISKRKT